MIKLFFNKTWTTALPILLICSFLQLTACGTILYPERKGQRAGRLDPAIVVLDAIGLLFFIIPGVIAFAVDFNNGSIYLPGGKGKQGSVQDVKIVKFDPNGTSPDDLSRLIEHHTEKKIAFTDQRMYVYRADRIENPISFVRQANH